MPTKELWGTFSTFPMIISNRSKTKSIKFGGQSISLGLVAPKILDAIYAEYYSGPREKCMIHEWSLGKMHGPFICLTVAILCHSLSCWRTGKFINNLAFTCASSKARINNAALPFSEVA